MQDNSLADMFLPLDGVSGQRPRGSGIWSSALVLAGVLDAQPLWNMMERMPGEMRWNPGGAGDTAKD